MVIVHIKTGKGVFFWVMAKITTFFEIGYLNTRFVICGQKYQRDTLSQTGYLKYAIQDWVSSSNLYFF